MMKMLLVTWLVLVGASADDSLVSRSEAVRYDRAAKNKTGLRNSDVCLSCRMVNKEHPAQEAVTLWKPTRLEWSYIRDPKFIRFAQDKGALFVGTLNTIQGEGPEFDAERVDGTRMVAPWMTGFNDSGGPGWNSVFKPGSLQIQKGLLDDFIGQGVTTIQHDDWMFNLSSYFWGGGDFCPESLAAFRQYLGDNATAHHRAAAGVTTWDDFDYRAYLRDTMGWTSPEELREDRGKDPLLIPWRRMHLLASRRHFERLLEAGQDVAGAPIHLSVNAKMSRLQDFFLLDLVDYLVGETPVSGAKEEDDLVYMLKLANALNLPQVVSPYPKDGPVNVAATRRTIALSYALGHRMLVPWDVWAGPGQPRWFGTVAEYGDLFDFVRAHAQWLDGYREYAEAVVIVPLSGVPGAASQAPPDAARKVAVTLQRNGVPCRFAACGNVAQLIDIPVDATDFEGVKMAVVTGSTETLPDGDRKTLAEAASRMPFIQVGDDANTRSLPRAYDTGTDNDVLVYLRDKVGAPRTVHLINRGVSGRDIELRLAPRLFPEGIPASSTLCRPGAQDIAIPLSAKDDWVMARLPGVSEWALVVLGPPKD
jgi:hypothetical protein